MSSKTVWVDDKWVADYGEDQEILRIFVAGLFDGAQDEGWDELPTTEDTGSWFGLTAKEVGDLYFQLGVMINENAISQSEGEEPPEMGS